MIWFASKEELCITYYRKKETWNIDDDATVNYLKEKVIVIIVIITAKALTNEQNLWNEDLLDDLENKYLFIKFLLLFLKFMNSCSFRCLAYVKCGCSLITFFNGFNNVINSFFLDQSDCTASKTTSCHPRTIYSFTF